MNTTVKQRLDRLFRLKGLADPTTTTTTAAAAAKHHDHPRQPKHIDDDPAAPLVCPACNLHISWHQLRFGFENQTYVCPRDECHAAFCIVCKKTTTTMGRVPVCVCHGGDDDDGDDGDRGRRLVAVVVVDQRLVLLLAKLKKALVNLNWWCTFGTLFAKDCRRGVVELHVRRCRKVADRVYARVLREYPQGGGGGGGGAVLLAPVVRGEEVGISDESASEDWEQEGDLNELCQHVLPSLEREETLLNSRDWDRRGR